MHVEVIHYPGYVYRLDANCISVYDSMGIGLRLSDRLLAVIARDVVNQRRSAKYLDGKGRRFTVEVRNEQMVFDVVGGEMITVEGALLYPQEEQMAA